MVLVALVGLWTGFPFAGLLAQQAGAESASAAVHITVLDTVIHPVAAQQVADAISRAEAAEAALVVIELDTPGGLLKSTREINQSILAAGVPVVVWVGPSGAQAASAGFFILLASDVATMAPGTNTGAAHPVGGRGETLEGEMGEKVEQDTAAMARSLAERRSRDPQLAEAAVTDSRSFSAEEAIASGLADLLATDREDLLRQLAGREVVRPDGSILRLDFADAAVVEYRLGSFQRLLALVAQPDIAYILMALGWLGLYVEISNPGQIFPGVLGAVCLILGFYGLSVLPVSYAGLALMTLALVLFVAELYTPTFGVLTTGGAVAFLAGSLMLFRDAGPALQVGRILVLGVGGSLAAVSAVLALKTLQLRRRPRRQSGLVGKVGTSRGPLDPKGKVFVHGELWQARSEPPVADGVAVEVLAVEGLRLIVQPVEAPGSVVGERPVSDA